MVDDDRVVERHAGGLTGGDVWQSKRLTLSVPGGREAMLPESVQLEEDGSRRA